MVVETQGDMQMMMEAFSSEAHMLTRVIAGFNHF